MNVQFAEFLGIILRVLILEVSVWISETMGKGDMAFYQVFLFSSF
jgi:hypothetical protein